MPPLENRAAACFIIVGMRYRSSRARSNAPANRRALIALFIVSVIGGLIIAAALSLPRLVSVSPAASAVNVSPHARIRFTFDRAMDAASLTAALRVQPDLPGSVAWDEAARTLTFIPNQPWPLQSAVTVTLSGGRSSLGLPLTEAQTWSFTVGEERFVFLTGAPSNLAVQAITPGDTPTPLTGEPFGVEDYAIRFDGEQIVYAAQREDGGADLRAVSIEGGDAREVLLCPEAACVNPAFSPDGTRVAYERQTLVKGASGAMEFGEPRVHTLTLATGANVAVGDPANQLSGATRAPQWGPDGRLSFYDAARAAVVILDTVSDAVTYVPNLAGARGSWAPDAQSFVLPEVVLQETAVVPSVAGLYSRLQRVTIATNAAQNLSGDGVVEDVSPVYSVSGEWLAFARKGLTRETWTPGRQLWAMRADGSEAKPLTDAADYHHSAFAWSLDDRYLLYMRSNATDPAAPVEIWLMNADGTGARKLVSGGYAPKWLP
ncbi:MAG: Ig-like domain-containing protein [Anaerolineales bacterium]